MVFCCLLSVDVSHTIIHRLFEIESTMSSPLSRNHTYDTSGLVDETGWIERTSPDTLSTINELSREVTKSLLFYSALTGKTGQFNRVLSTAYRIYIPMVLHADRPGRPE